MNLTLFNKKLRCLNIKEEKYYDKFLREIKNNNNIEILYRGMDIGDICDRLSILQDPNTMYAKLADKLFMIGEKSKYFLQEKNFFDIQRTDISDDVFIKIFDMLRSKKWYGIDSYIKQEEEFFDYFLDKKNKNKFIEAMNKLNKTDKLFFKNYYLKLLHQLSCVEYKEYSCFLSTSKDVNIARQFSIEKGGSGIVLCCWKIKNIKLKHKKYKEIEIPTYTTYPFPDEREETEELGIFPHFIYGFKITKKIESEEKFVINHHMFSDSNTNIKTTVQFGFNIDQSNFNQYLKQTKYKDSFTNSDLY